MDTSQSDASGKHEALPAPASEPTALPVVRPRLAEFRAWPHRIRVTITNYSDVSVTHHIVTWRSVEKAIAMAVENHLSRYTDEQWETRISDVEVEDLGPLPREGQEPMRVGPKDLTDRMEW